MTIQITDTTYTHDKTRKRFDVILTDDQITFHTYPISQPGTNRQDDVEARALQKFFPFLYAAFNQHCPSTKSFFGILEHHNTTSYPLNDIKNLVSAQRFLSDKDNGMDPQKRQAALAVIKQKLQACDPIEVHKVHAELNLKLLNGNDAKKDAHHRHLVTITDNQFFTVQHVKYEYSSDIPKNEFFDIAKFDANAQKIGTKYTTDSISGPLTHQNLATLIKLTTADAVGYRDYAANVLRSSKLDVTEVAQDKPAQSAHATHQAVNQVAVATLKS